VLNPGFSVEAEEAYGSSYVVPAALREAIVGANAEFDTGAERRTQRAFGDELWFRLRELGVHDLPWSELRVLDACCGTGFLSYHLLARAQPRELTMLDVSADEVRAAERLVGPGRAEAVVGDLATASLEPFDVVMGNSFLHHFPDVPDVLASVFRLTRPGGLFVGLHEPTPAALPWESGDPRQVVSYFLSRRRYMDGTRHPGPGPVRDGTTDVWIFEAEDVSRMLAEAGFTEVRVLPRYLLRPLVMATLRLHLSESRPRLSRFESLLLRASVRLDGLLRRVLPARAFGGVTFVARRPA
jgi:SAM-dependent methyltransferase